MTKRVKCVEHAKYTILNLVYFEGFGTHYKICIAALMDIFHGIFQKRELVSPPPNWILHLRRRHRSNMIDVVIKELIVALDEL